MANVDVTSLQQATFGVGSHGDESFASAEDSNALTPAQMRWQDIHPAGLVVLPKGSAAAGAGEINWEDTLGGKFALAMQKLEGLLYAMFGSRPDAIVDSSEPTGWVIRQWYDRLHPRCLWGPEMWERSSIDPTPACEAAPGSCWEYKATGKEYAALGENPPCCSMPVPSVPIRSRSGDPGRQYQLGSHDRDNFPIGSVSRAYSTTPFDPGGKGYFGASYPGRHDAVGTWYAGEAVTVSYTPPNPLPEGTFYGAKLYYNVSEDGVTWPVSFTEVSMTGGPTYTADIPAQYHGYYVRWYVSLTYSIMMGPVEIYRTIYDPGSTTAPTLGTAYSFRFWYHYNPYANGLPEMLDAYGDNGDVDIRHGTDYYQFDSSETIQFELLNMVRWVLSWLGGDCCTGEYDACAETDLRADAVQFNPRFRGGGNGACCIYMPIRFRWSGSNQHPHYLTGGKSTEEQSDGTVGTSPLHNRDTDTGSSAARKTWRGISMLYTGVPLENVHYGGGYSWGTAPGTFTLMYVPAESSEPQVYATYPSWGLRAGDVIEAVHIQEIIDAIDYLIDYGAWATAPIYSTPMSPGTYQGHECGTVHDIQPFSEEWNILYCNKCCQPDPGCEGGWYRYWEEGSLIWDYYDPDPPVCVEWEAPSHSACWAASSYGYCGMVAIRTATGNCVSAVGGEETAEWSNLTVNCNDDEGINACGTVWSERECQEYITGTSNFHRQISERVEGWSKYMCTPPACWGGWDSIHGNGYAFIKKRYDHVWHESGALQEIDTGPDGGESSGNCFGDMYACGDTYPEDSGDSGVWFEEVTGVRFNGLVDGLWWEHRDADAVCECWDEESYDLYPDVPGLGQHNGDNEALCSQNLQAVAYGYRNADVSCACSASSLGDVCLGKLVWVAVNLNLDGTGRPYRYFPGRNGDAAEYTGVGIPRLTDYELDKDPDTWMHECPCETWTNEENCVVGA